MQHSVAEQLPKRPSLPQGNQDNVGDGNEEMRNEKRQHQQSQTDDINNGTNGSGYSGHQTSNTSKPLDPDEEQVGNNDDDDMPPRPPLRVESQMSTASRNTISVTPVKSFNTAQAKPVRPRWFRIAYVAVGIAIFGILTAVCGSILFILRMTKFQTGTEGRYHSYYFGRRVPKLLGVYLAVAGVCITFFGWLFYHAALIRIDRYIEDLHAYNSKKHKEAREAGFTAGPSDPLLEEDEDEYNEYEKKTKQLDY